MGAATSSLPEKHSVEVGTPAAGEGAIRRRWPQDLPFESKFGPDICNLYKQFANAVKLNPNGNCMGKRVKGADGKAGPFEYISFTTAHEQILTIGSGLASLGVKPKESFGMYAKNSIEWQLCAIGGFSQGLTCVPVYDTLGDNIVLYEANHAEMSLMFVEASKLKAVAAVLKDCTTLKHIIQIEPLGEVSAEISAAFKAAGVELTDLQSIMAAGTKSPVKECSSAGEDLAFIMYTSGTTGMPKGVCISNMSIVVGSSWCAGIELKKSDRYLSYLPLAHIFETMVEHAIWSVGASVGFYNGNIKLLQDDILALKPTLFVGVPRVYQRFYDAAYQKIDAMPGALKNSILHMLTAQVDAVKNGTSTIYGPILQKLLGAKLTGGAVRIMISGAAPLPLYVQEFLLAACGGSVVQGYGMTENCANATIADLADYRSGHVGGPMPTMEIKLVDVPEMNYTSSGEGLPTGEVVTRGAPVFKGYHKNQEETDKVLTADGWLHTGDIGRWNADGTLSIIDRKKNIFKLAQGEYIAAEKIEMALAKSKYISQPWVYGNSFFPMLVAVVTPDFATLIPTAKQQGWFVEDKVQLVQKPEAVALILQEIEAEAKAAALKSFEVPKKVLLEGAVNELAQGFSIENDCLTPTFKLKRPQLLKRYEAQIDAMYVELGEDPSKHKRQ